MSAEEKYQALQDQYRELQLRVTQFSSVEQQLIDTRDSLDQELEQYKRLNTFNADILSASDEQTFTRIIAEAIIDIFEIESSIVFTGDFTSIHTGQTSHESLGLKEEQIETLLFELIAFSNIPSPGQADLKQEKGLLNAYADCLIFSHHDADNKNNILVAGLISKARLPLYKKIDQRKKTIFNVFVDQVKLQYSNRLKKIQINAQLEQISRSEIELKMLSTIATKTKNSVLISNPKGEIEWVNESFTAVSGFKLEDIIGRKPKDFLHGTQTDPVTQQKISEALRKKEVVEAVVINYTKSGEEYYNQLEITPIFNDQGEHIHFIALQKDITNEVNYRKEILTINSRFELITDMSQIGVWEWDTRTNNTSWNAILKNQYGLEEDTSEIDLYAYFQDAIVEEDRTRVMTELGALMSTEKNGVNQTFRIHNRKTNEIRHLRCFTLTERDNQGELLRMIGSSLDITDELNIQNDIIQKNEELRKINAELDNFVYSVSHDLRSPLVSIKGILTNVLKSEHLDEKTIRFLNLAEISVMRLDGTIQEILEYSRNARLNIELGTFNLHETCQSIFDDLKYSVGEEFEFMLDCPDTTPFVSDKSRINGLLKNVIGNAVKYRKKDIPDPFVRVKIDRQEHQTIIQVSDNGQGIPSKSLSRIFEMFYRATNSSVGTGLGLYICKEIVNKLEGKIAAESIEGSGTTITISIPKQVLTEETDHGH